MVHCQAGKSRSATIAIGKIPFFFLFSQQILAYIMRHKKLSMDEAHFFVRSKRHQIDPNFAFLGQLLDYENILSGKLPQQENEKVKNAEQVEKRRILAPKIGTLQDLNVISRKRNRPPPASLVIGDSRKRRLKNSEDFAGTIENKPFYILDIFALSLAGKMTN
jgi:hypothetical protein